MTIENVLLLAGAATAVYLIWQELLVTSSASDTTVPLRDKLASLVCPTGTVIISDGTCCASANVQPDGTCGACAVGTTSAHDTTGNPVCCPNTNLDASGICQVCPIGYSPNADNSACVNADGTSVPGFGLNFTTGNAIGDMVVNMGITVASNLGFDEAGKAIAKAVAKPATAKPADPAPTEVVDEATKPPDEATKPPVEEQSTVKPVESIEPVEPPTVEPLEPVEPPAIRPVDPIKPPTSIAETAAETTADVATEAAEEASALAAKKAGAEVAQQASEKIAVEVGSQLAESLGEAAVEASTVIGIPLAILDLLLAAVTMGLTYGLSLTPDSFEPDGPGDFGFSDLPDWANDIMAGIPLIGSIIQLLSPIVVIHTGCAPNQDNEANLCYDKPKDTGDPNTHWECHGFLCYLHDSKFEGEALSSTFADVTKRINVDTGTLPNTCPAGQVQSGALCYDAVPNASIVAGVAWSNCPDGYTDEGALCSNLKSTGVGTIPQLGPCDSGQRDDGVSCWEDLKTTGGDCSTNCSWGGWHNTILSCSTNCNPIVTTGCGCIKKTAMDRGQICPDGGDLVSGLCYSPCPSGSSREPGGLLCGGTVAKSSQVLTPHSMQCSGDRPTEIAGLCYGSIPDGYSRQVPGLLSQNCPSGWTDIGVACQRPTYTRAPTPGIFFHIRDRKHSQQAQTPKTCAQLGITNPDTLAYCNSLLCLADEDIATGASADFCVERCRDSYVPGPNGMCVRPAGGIDPLSGNPFVADQYQRRNPFLITWNSGTTPPSTAESDWDTFTSANATDVSASNLQAALTGTTGPTFNINSATGFGVQAYSGSQVFTGGDISGQLAIQAQATLANGDTALIAQDGSNVLVYDTKTNEAREFAGDLGSFDPGSWANYAASALGFSLATSLQIGSVISLRNVSTNQALVATAGNGIELTSDYGWGNFIVQDAGQGNVGLQNNVTGTYLSVCLNCVSDGVYSVDAHEGLMGSDTVWAVVPAGNGVALRNTMSGTYLSACASCTNLVDVHETSASPDAVWAVTVISAP